MPTMSGRLFASSTSACPNGAGLSADGLPRRSKRSWPSVKPRLRRVDLGECSLVAHRSFSPSSAAIALSHSSASTRMKWFFSRCSRNRHALAHQRVADDRPRRGAVDAGARRRPRPVRRCRCRRRVGYASQTPEFAVDRLARQHVPRRTVGLLIVDVHDGDQVVELPMRRRHRRLPRRSPRRARRRTADCRRSFRPLRFSPRQTPTAMVRPWPSEPPEISMPGV